MIPIVQCLFYHSLSSIHAVVHAFRAAIRFILRIRFFIVPQTIDILQIHRLSLHCFSNSLGNRMNENFHQMVLKPCTCIYNRRKQRCGVCHIVSRTTVVAGFCQRNCFPSTRSTCMTKRRTTRRSAATKLPVCQQFFVLRVRGGCTPRTIVYWQRLNAVLTLRVNFRRCGVSV